MLLVIEIGGNTAGGDCVVSIWHSVPMKSPVHSLPSGVVVSATPLLPHARERAELRDVAVGRVAV